MPILETRSAIVLILSMGLLVTPAFSADSTSSPAATNSVSTPAVEEAVTIDTVKDRSIVPPVEPVNAPTNFSGGLSESVLGGDATGGASQQAVTAGYELGGTGVAGGRMTTQGNILTSPAKGRPIRFENGIFVYPAALVGLGYNDNVLGTTVNRTSSSLWVLQPGVVTEFKTHGDRYTLSYLGNYGRYASSSADDYNYHEFWMAADNYFTSRTRLGWGVGYLERSDPRGSTNRVSSSEPDRWHAPVVRALGIYGAPGAIGRIELETSWMQKRYENNRAFTETADVDQTMVAGRFYYRFLPRTSALVEVRNTWSTYVATNAFPGDNADTRLYAGLTWEATAKTSGTFKIGRAYKSFSNAALSESSLSSWEGNVRWSPLTYSTFDLATSRTPTDTTGVGNFLTNTGTSLTWTHKWASYISSRVSAGILKTEYAADPRKDDTRNYGVGFFTELGYRTRLGLDWGYTNRNSNQDLFDFKRNVVMATLEFVL